MKNLIKSALFIMLVGVVSIVACDKEDLKAESTENNQEISFENFGKYHNEILDKFYKAKRKKSTFTFNEKVELIDTYLASVVDSINEGEFTTILNNQQKQKEYLQRIENTDSDIITGREIINNLIDDNQISNLEYNYFNSIINAYETYPFLFTELLLELNNIEEQVLNNENISNKEKKNLLSVLDISKASVKYWSNEDNLKNAKSTKEIPWYAKDAVGAMTGVQTGLVGYATALAGPWGGGAALLGCAALASCV